MLLNKIYYLLKPIIPHSLRLAMRRRRATARRIAYAKVWPIDAKAGTTPPNWPGWPEGKKFAFVLTHDVEGSRGLGLSLIHISEPTRQAEISYAVFCLKK